MTSYEFERLFIFAMSSRTIRLSLSDVGDYLIARGESGELRYRSWNEDGDLWSGVVPRQLANIAISPDRSRIVMVRDAHVVAFSSGGTELWRYEAAGWQIHSLYLNGGTPVVMAAKRNAVASLGDRGEPVWHYDAGAPVRNVRVNVDGTMIGVVIEKELIVLDSLGRLQWRTPVAGASGALCVGSDRLVVADGRGQVLSFRLDSELLAESEPFGSVQELAISGTGGYVAVAVGSSNEVQVMRLRSKQAIAYVPVLPRRSGIATTLSTMPNGAVRDLHQSIASKCIVIEAEQEIACFDYDGTPLWWCPKPQIRQPPPPPPPPPPVSHSGIIERINSGNWQVGGMTIVLNDRTRINESPVIGDTAEIRGLRQPNGQLLATDVNVTPNPNRLVLEQIKQAFVSYAQSESARLDREAQARLNVWLNGERLDLYFKGQGYIFEVNADRDSLQRAIRLAQNFNITIIAIYANSDTVVNVKQTKRVELYRLDDMTKTEGGLFRISDFEAYIILALKQTFRKI